MNESSMFSIWTSTFIFFLSIQHLMHVIVWLFIFAIIEFQTKFSTNFDTKSFDEKTISTSWMKNTSFENKLFFNVKNDMKFIWNFQSCEFVETLTLLKKLKFNMLKTTLLKLKFFKSKSWINKIIVNVSKTLSLMS